MRFLTVVFSLALIAGCGDSSSSVQKLAIGSPCTVSSDCGTGDFFCATQGHPNGYCKKYCKADPDCPAGSVCASIRPCTTATRSRPITTRWWASSSCMAGRAANA